MISGFNHNIRYRGLLFHVQTEDKGRKNPTIESHLFFGGNVVATRKSTYQSVIDTNGEEDEIVRLMQEQHKSLLKDLVSGKIRAAEEVVASLTRPAEIPAAPPTAPSAKPLGAVPPPLGQRPAIPPPHTAPRPYRKQGAADKPAESFQPPHVVRPRPLRTLDADKGSEKTLDELILQFLKDEEEPR